MTTRLAALLIILAGAARADQLSVRLTVTGGLPFPRVPMDPVIDFGALIADADILGILDPNSIRVIDIATGRRVPSATEGFAGSDTGNVQWVITDATHRVYDIRFRTVNRRPELAPARLAPLIGVGDLLRYNAGEGRPLVATRCMSGLVDVTGDGKRDLVGIRSYSHRPGMPWHSSVVWPRVGSPSRLRFGDMRAIPSLPALAYCASDFRDVNADGLADVVHAKVFHGTGQTTLSVYLNSGTFATGLADFEHAVDLPPQPFEWHSLRCVDLDSDGALDIVLIDDGRYTDRSTTYFIRNENLDGWPFELSEARLLDVAGYKADFIDLDGDALLDAVSLIDVAAPRGLSDFKLVWQQNLGSDSPSFGRPRDLPGAQLTRPRDLLAVREGPHRGLLVVYDDKERTALLRLDGERVTSTTNVGSTSAVLSLSDQASPDIADWDGDGDWDLIVGGGYGWPRVVINRGTSERPRLSESRLIESDGEPIRIVREEIIGSPGHQHNMGYAYPAYVDWDADGLPDLMLPNETNRIFWYRNVGRRARPRFGEQRQLICDGFPDSPEHREKSRLLTIDPDLNCYPAEDDRPFPWRTGAGFADFTGDGLMDMVTMCGVEPRRATLFVQYRDEFGGLRLKRDVTLKTTGGSTISASRFRPVDWDADGDMDIICSMSTSKVQDTFFLAENVGADDELLFDYGPLRCFGEQLYVTRHGPKVGVGDLDADGLPDILASTEWSVYPFYTHAALSMDKRPSFTLGKVRRP